MDKQSKDTVYTYTILLAFDLSVNIFLFFLGYNLYVLYHLELKEKIFEIYKTLRLIIDMGLVCAKIPGIWMYNFLLRQYETRDQLLPRLVYALKLKYSSVVSFLNTTYALKICYYNVCKACVTYYAKAYFFLIFTTVKTTIFAIITSVNIFWSCLVNFYQALIHVLLMFISMCILVINLSAFLYASYLTVYFIIFNRAIIFSLSIFFLCVCGVLYLDLINR